MKLKQLVFTLIIAFSVIACSKSDNTNELAVSEGDRQSDSALKKLPKFELKEDYGNVRKKILAAGWIPFHTPNADKCNLGDIRCEGRPEMEACSGSGLARCLFTWKKEDQILRISTTGESPAVYAGSSIEIIKKEDTQISIPSLEDGKYIYKSRVVKGTEVCNAEKEKCLSLEQYKNLCSEVSSITKGMEGYYSMLADQAFVQLLKGGEIDGIKSEWLGESSWKEDSGIIGACEVTVTVSGIYEGSSTRKSFSVFAKEFIVHEKKVMLHTPSSGSAWML